MLENAKEFEREVGTKAGVQEIKQFEQKLKRYDLRKERNRCAVLDDLQKLTNSKSCVMCTVLDQVGHDVVRSYWNDLDCSRAKLDKRRKRQTRRKSKKTVRPRRRV